MIRFLFVLLLSFIPVPPKHAQAPCDQPGWSPEYGLKDHTIFQYRDHYYLASNYLGDDAYEQQFAYARSTDLCRWEDLGPILGDRRPGTWDQFGVWAPHVVEQNGIYYLYYTGVATGVTQSIMLATTKTPDVPASWQRQGVVFQPNHEGAVWPGYGFWSDARDPWVTYIDGIWHMYYTGLNVDGGIVGLATADRPIGPWHDQGAVFTEPKSTPESSGVVEENGQYYLFFNNTGSQSEVVVRGPTPSGPWSSSTSIGPGWAHEFWLAADGQWMTSYLTGYAITIAPVTWTGAVPLIGWQIYQTWLPHIES